MLLSLINLDPISVYCSTVPCEIIWGMWHLSQEASRVCNDPRKTNWLVTTYIVLLGTTFSSVRPHATTVLKLEISIPLKILIHNLLLLDALCMLGCDISSPKQHFSICCCCSVCRWHLPWLAVNGWNSLQQQQLSCPKARIIVIISAQWWWSWKANSSFSESRADEHSSTYKMNGQNAIAVNATCSLVVRADRPNIIIAKIRHF